MVNRERYVAFFKSEVYEMPFLMDCMATETLLEEHVLIRLLFFGEVLFDYPVNLNSYFKVLFL